MIGQIAEIGGEIAGFSISVCHPGTWSAGSACYLEDLYVDPAHRGQGIGRALIQNLRDLGKQHGWATLYWHTRHDNPARTLYDEFAGADDFVRYRLIL
jgi:GNAT superfamily N-acetyltransferase